MTDDSRLPVGGGRTPLGRSLLRPLLFLLLVGTTAGGCVAPEAPDGVAAEVEPSSRMQRALAAREYQASANGVGLQAPNRAHNFRTYFEPAGIRVHDRTAAGSPELLGLSLVGLGRGEALVPVGTGDVVSAGARVEIRRPGLVEWYANSPAGLEQGFTLTERPEGEGALALELSIAGAHASLRGETVLFEAETRRLEYGKLLVVDAQGARLPALFSLPEAGRLRIAVTDAGAVYPVTIDPLLAETADTLVESDQEGALLGSSVSSAGDVNGDGHADVIVGAPLYDAGQVDEGAAFVFLGSGSGILDGQPATAATQLEADQPEAQLGSSVSSAGDVNGDGYADVVVGAPLYDADQLDEGAVFVFLGGAAGIIDGSPATAATQLESDQPDARLGSSVSSAGDVNGDGYADLLVGAPLYDAGTVDEGVALVFLGGAGGLGDGNPMTAAAMLESDQMDAQLGSSVSSAGDVNGDGYADVVVGAPLYDEGQVDEGAAFVFLGGVAGVVDGNPAVASSQLEADQGDAQLGSSVASAGDVNGDGYADVVVGAPLYDEGQVDEGAAFVFLGGASGVVDGNPATAATQVESDQRDAQLGASVSSAGDVNGDGYADLLVGAPLYDDPETDEGAVFVFLGGPGGIADGAPATASTQLESDLEDAQLGAGVAGAGDVNGDGYADVIVGAALYDLGEIDEGAALVFLGGASGVVDGNPATAATQLSSSQPSAYLGVSVAGAGDVNGDGHADVIVGAPLYDAGQVDEGAAFVFLGGPDGIADSTPAMAATQLESDQAFSELGTSVAGAGDVNGDGYGDVIVGAPFFYDPVGIDGGAAFIFLGGPGGIADGAPTTAAAQLESDQAFSELGTSVASAGDVNGDGYADVIVGARYYSETNQMNEGAAFVFLGGAAGVASGDTTTAAAHLESDQPFAYMGWSVSGAGDVNGDGYADVIVGSPYYDNGASNEGAAFVFLGSSSGVVDGDPTTAAARLESDQAFAYQGWSVAGAGDVNGDGYGDVIVGARYYADGGQSQEGAAFIFLGGATGIADGNPSTASTQLEADQMGALLGWSVAGAGDVNGDGYADVLVGAPFYENGDPSEGSAFVFLGSENGIADGNPMTAGTQLESNQAIAYLGWSVAGAGDVNGDGFADVLAGAYFYSAGFANEGAAFLFLGNDEGNGRPVLARQRRGDGSGMPVEPWGGSENGEAFEVLLQATHPAGRGRVRLEVESCPKGLAFGDPGCVRQAGSSWTDVTAGADGVTLIESIAGLANGELYRWRARVLYAPFAVTAAGITPPPNPAHGPWRRVSAQAREADIRVLPEPGAGVVLPLAMGLALLGRRRRSA